MEPDGHGDVTCQPTSYVFVWNDSGSGRSLEGSFWRVQAPSGNVALGDADVSCNRNELHPSAFAAKHACI